MTVLNMVGFAEEQDTMLGQSEYALFNQVITNTIAWGQLLNTYPLCV